MLRGGSIPFRHHGVIFKPSLTTWACPGTGSDSAIISDEDAKQLSLAALKDVYVDPEMENCAGVLISGTDGGELPLGWRGLTKLIAAPAGNGAIVPHSAGVMSSGADGGEPALGRSGLAIFIPAPASDGAVVPHPAWMEKADAHGGESTRGGCGIVFICATPTCNGSIIPHTTGIVGASAHRSESAIRWRICPGPR